MIVVLHIPAATVYGLAKHSRRPHMQRAHRHFYRTCGHGIDIDENQRRSGTVAVSSVWWGTIWDWRSWRVATLSLVPLDTSHGVNFVALVDRRVCEMRLVQRLLSDHYFHSNPLSCWSREGGAWI